MGYPLVFIVGLKVGEVVGENKRSSNNGDDSSSGVLLVGFGIFKIYWKKVVGGKVETSDWGNNVEFVIVFPEELYVG